MLKFDCCREFLLMFKTFIFRTSTLIIKILNRPRLKTVASPIFSRTREAVAEVASSFVGTQLVPGKVRLLREIVRQLFVQFSSQIKNVLTPSTLEWTGVFWLFFSIISASTIIDGCLNFRMMGRLTFSFFQTSSSEIMPDWFVGILAPVVKASLACLFSIVLQSRSICWKKRRGPSWSQRWSPTLLIRKIGVEPLLLRSCFDLDLIPTSLFRSGIDDADVFDRALTSKFCHAGLRCRWFRQKRNFARIFERCVHLRVRFRLHQTPQVIWNTFRTVQCFDASWIFGNRCGSRVLLVRILGLFVGPRCSRNVGDWDRSQDFSLVFYFGKFDPRHFQTFRFWVVHEGGEESFGHKQSHIEISVVVDDLKKLNSFEIVLTLTFKLLQHACVSFFCSILKVLVWNTKK